MCHGGHGVNLLPATTTRQHGALLGAGVPEIFVQRRRRLESREDQVFGHPVWVWHTEGESQPTIADTTNDTHTHITPSVQNPNNFPKLVFLARHCFDPSETLPFPLFRIYPSRQKWDERRGRPTSGPYVRHVPGHLPHPPADRGQWCCPCGLEFLPRTRVV